MIITVLSYNTRSSCWLMSFMVCFGGAIFVCLHNYHVCSLSDVVYNKSSVAFVAEFCKGTRSNKT